MTAHETLVKAREAISRPEDWCQHRLGTRHPDGTWSAPYCALGAIYYGSGEGTMVRNPNATAAARALGDVLPSGILISTYNNNRSHECVIAAFDAAIEATAPAIDRAMW